MFNSIIVSKEQFEFLLWRRGVGLPKRDLVLFLFESWPDICLPPRAWPYMGDAKLGDPSAGSVRAAIPHKWNSLYSIRVYQQRDWMTSMSPQTLLLDLTTETQIDWTVSGRLTPVPCSSSLSARALVPSKEQNTVGSLSEGEKSFQNVPALINYYQSYYETQPSISRILY